MDAELVELVERAKRRDAAAFGALVRRFERTALAVAYAQLRDGSLAADATQEAFLKAWQKLGGLSDCTRFTPWFYGVVRNVAIDHRRRVQSQRGAGGEPASFESRLRGVRDPAGDLDQSETRAEVAAALEAIDDLSRTAVVLRYYENLSSREIGELLDLTPAAVDMRLSRARVELRERLAGVIQITGGAVGK